MKNLICIIISLMLFVSNSNAFLVNETTVNKDSSGIKIVISTDAFTYKAITLHNSERLVIDFEDAFCKLKPRIEVNSSPIICIRASQYKPQPTPITRVVVDLEQPTDYLINRIENGIEINFTRNLAVSSAVTPTTLSNASPEAPKTEAPKTETPKTETPKTADTGIIIPSDTNVTESEEGDSLSIVAEVISHDTILKDTTIPLKEPFYYNSRGKRDPFKPWLGIESGPSDSLLDVSTATIAGIMWSPKDRYALAQDNAGKGYILCEGDKVWSGTVDRIEKDNVVFALHGFGGIKKITLKLLPKEERKKEEK